LKSSNIFIAATTTMTVATSSLEPTAGAISKVSYCSVATEMFISAWLITLILMWCDSVFVSVVEHANEHDDELNHASSVYNHYYHN